MQVQTAAARSRPSPSPAPAAPPEMVFTTRRKKTEDEAQAEAEARQTRELCSALARLPLMGKLNQLKPGQELPEKLRDMQRSGPRLGEATITVLDDVGGGAPKVVNTSELTSQVAAMVRAAKQASASAGVPTTPARGGTDEALGA